MEEMRDIEYKISPLRVATPPEIVSNSEYRNVDASNAREKVLINLVNYSKED